MGMLAGVLLDRRRRPAIRVPLAEHGVDRAALDLVVARPYVALLVVAGLLRVIGDRVPLALQLLDRGLELRHRSADVRQLDDVRLRGLGQVAELGKRVRDPLGLVEHVGELGQDPRRERDVADLDLDVGGGRERTHNRQQRLRGERGGLVGQRVDDLHGVRQGSGAAGLAVEGARKVSPQVLDVLEADAEAEQAGRDPCPFVAGTRFERRRDSAEAGRVLDQP